MIFVGPTYKLASKKADVQSSINMYLKKIESGGSKSGVNFFLEQIPGLVEFCDCELTIRGVIEAQDRAFVVAGSTFYEIDSDGVKTSRGTLLTSDGTVSLARGLDQVVVVDGDYGYVFDLSANTFTQITTSGFLGSQTVSYIDGYFVFTDPDTQQYYISSVEDATTIDTLDFASAEGSPDNIVTAVVSHREIWLFGTDSVEVHYNNGNADFPFTRNNTAYMEVGCAAPFSAMTIDNSVMWVSRSKEGHGQVFRAASYVPKRASNFAVEEALARSTNLEGTTAYTYQQEGQTFYCLNIPGIDVTWCFEVTSGEWHERAEINTGPRTQHRATCHFFCFGKNLVGSESGIIYELTPDEYTNDGDPIYRERTSPHDATPSLDWKVFTTLRLDVTVGDCPQGVEPLIELCWSDDGGNTWGNWLSRSLGEVGQFRTRVEWHRLGRSRDRVWKVRTTSEAKIAIVGAAVL